MSLYKGAAILQCDGGGTQESSEEDTSETSVDTSEDEESSDSDNEDDEVATNAKQRRSTRKSAAEVVTSQRGRVTRQQSGKNEGSSKRLLRSRKKSPVAGSGAKQAQVFRCPTCNKEFNNQASVNRHKRWCKPKATPKKKKRESKDGVESKKNVSTPTKGDAVQAPTSVGTPDKPRGRGRPRKNVSHDTPTSVTQTTPPQQHREQVIQHGGPESISPGFHDTSSESDYEKREYAANAHINHRSSNASIDVVNDDPSPPPFANYDGVTLPGPSVRFEGPVKCSQCNQTYRTAEAFQNHLASCVMYTSSDDEDEEIDVQEDETESHVSSWPPPEALQGTTVTNQVQNVDTSEESSASSDESQPPPSVPSVGICSTPVAERTIHSPKPASVPALPVVGSGYNSIPTPPHLSGSTGGKERLTAFQNSPMVAQSQKSPEVTKLATENLNSSKVQLQEEARTLVPQMQRSPTAVHLKKQTRSPSHSPARLKSPNPPQYQVSVTSSPVLHHQHQQHPTSGSHIAPQLTFQPNCQSSPVATVPSSLSQQHYAVASPPPPPQMALESENSYDQTSTNSNGSVPQQLLHNAHQNTTTYTQAQIMPGTVVNSLMQMQQMSTAYHHQPVSTQSSIMTNSLFPSTSSYNNAIQAQNGVQQIGVLPVPTSLSQSKAIYLNNAPPHLGVQAPPPPPMIQQQSTIPQQVINSQLPPQQILQPHAQLPPVSMQQQQQHPPSQQEMQAQVLQTVPPPQPFSQAAVHGEEPKFAAPGPPQQAMQYPPQLQGAAVANNHFQASAGSARSYPSALQLAYGNGFSFQQIQIPAHQLQQNHLQTSSHQLQQGGVAMQTQEFTQQQTQFHQQYRPMVAPQTSSADQSNPYPHNIYPGMVQADALNSTPQTQIHQPHLPAHVPPPQEQLIQHQFIPGQTQAPKLLADNMAPQIMGHNNMQQQIPKGKLNGSPQNTICQSSEQIQAPFFHTNTAAAPNQFPFVQNFGQTQNMNPVIPTSTAFNLNPMPFQVQSYNQTAAPNLQQITSQMSHGASQDGQMGSSMSAQFPQQFNNSGQPHHIMAQAQMPQFQQHNQLNMQIQQQQLQQSGKVPQAPQNVQQLLNQAILSKAGVQMQALASQTQQPTTQQLNVAYAQQFQGNQPTATSLQQQQQQMQFQTPMIQQLAQLPDGSTIAILIASQPPQPANSTIPQNGVVTANNTAQFPTQEAGGNMLSLLPGLQNQPCQQQQTSPQIIQCSLTAATVPPHAPTGVIPTAAGSVGRSSAPCPCPSCKEKTSTANAMEKFKKVLPYPTDQTKKSHLSRPILMRPGKQQPRSLKLQKPVELLPNTGAANGLTPAASLSLIQNPAALRILPIAMKPALQEQGSNNPTSSSDQSSRPSASNSNIAVVRPMENPLQKLTDQISQIESSFLSTNPSEPLRLPRGPHLTLVTASPPPTLVATPTGSPQVATSVAELVITGGTVQQQQVVRSLALNKPVEVAPTQQSPQPRLMLVDHSTPTVVNNNNNVTAPSPDKSLLGKSSGSGLKRKAPVTGKEGGDSKSIKVTLRRKEGGNSYSVNHITGSATRPGTMKSLKIKGQIKSGEQAGTSTDVAVVPVIHKVPVPDPEGNEMDSNRTIAEDNTGDGVTLASAVKLSLSSEEGEANSNSRLTHRAVIVYEVQSNGTVLFRSSDVRAVWGYIFETVQGTRLNHNLPPLSYPATPIPLSQNENGEDASFNKSGLIHRAVQFLLKQLSEMTSKTSSEDEPVQENESGCARTERFTGRKPFDMFGWLASKHRKQPTSNPMLCTRPAEVTKNLLGTPLGMRFRKMKEKSENSLVVLWSTIHGRGLYTLRDIEKGEMIIEYAGEVIRPLVCDRREKYYESKSVGCYMFRINDHVIDATMKGNAARFINHSCEPSCEAKAVKISGKDHILIFAVRRIQRGEELTYDYKFEKEEEKIPCTCSSKNCRKYLN